MMYHRQTAPPSQCSEVCSAAKSAEDAQMDAATLSRRQRALERQHSLPIIMDYVDHPAGTGLLDVCQCKRRRRYAVITQTSRTTSVTANRTAEDSTYTSVQIPPADRRRRCALFRPILLICAAALRRGAIHMSFRPSRGLLPPAFVTTRPRRSRLTTEFLM